jgi:hypothetical protein
MRACGLEGWASLAVAAVDVPSTGVGEARHLQPQALAGRKPASALLERHRLVVSCLLSRVATLIMRCQ